MSTEKENADAKLKRQIEEHPAYMLLLNYIESGGDEKMLYGCTFKYIVQKMNGQLAPSDWHRFNVACHEFKLDEYYGIIWPFIQWKDPVALAEKLIELDVLKDDD